MAECCCPPPLNVDSQRGNQAYRRALWAVLAINAAMFLVEIGAGLAAGSASLQADALDFLGDAANYAISLFVVGLALRFRAMAALVKQMSQMSMLDKIRAMTGLGRAGAFNPGAKLFATKQGTGKRLSPKERAKLQKEREKEERRRRREQRNQGRDDGGSPPRPR